MASAGSGPRVSGAEAISAAGAPLEKGGASTEAEGGPDGYKVFTAGSPSVSNEAQRDLPGGSGPPSCRVCTPTMDHLSKFPGVGTCALRKSSNTQVTSGTAECPLDVDYHPFCWAERYRRRFVSPLHRPEAPQVSTGMRRRLLQFNFLDLVDATLDALAFQTPVASSFPPGGFQSCPSAPWLLRSSPLAHMNQTSSPIVTEAQVCTSCIHARRPGPRVAAASSASDSGAFEDNALAGSTVAPAASPPSSSSPPLEAGTGATSAASGKPSPQQGESQSFLSFDQTGPLLVDRAPLVLAPGRGGECVSSRRTYQSRDRATRPDGCELSPTSSARGGLGDTETRSDDKSIRLRVAASETRDKTPGNRDQLVGGGGRGRRSSPRPRVTGRYGLRQRDKINDARVSLFLASYGTHPLHEAMAWHLRRPCPLRKARQSADCPNADIQGDVLSVATTQASVFADGLPEAEKDAGTSEAINVGGARAASAREPSDHQVGVSHREPNHEAHSLRPSSASHCTDCGIAFPTTELARMSTTSGSPLPEQVTSAAVEKTKAGFGRGEPSHRVYQSCDGQREHSGGSVHEGNLERESARQSGHHRRRTRAETSATPGQREENEDSVRASSVLSRPPSRTAADLVCTGLSADINNCSPLEDTQLIPPASGSFSSMDRFGAISGEGSGFRGVPGTRLSTLGDTPSSLSTLAFEPENIGKGESFPAPGTETPLAGGSCPSSASSLLAPEIASTVSGSHRDGKGEALPFGAETGLAAQVSRPGASPATRLSVFPCKSIRPSRIRHDYVLPVAPVSVRSEELCASPSLPRMCPLPHQGFSGFSPFIELRRLKSRPDPKKHGNPSALRKPKCMNTSYLPRLSTAAPPPIEDVFLPDLELFRREVYQWMKEVVADFVPSSTCGHGVARDAQERKPGALQPSVPEPPSNVKPDTDANGSFPSDSSTTVRGRLGVNSLSSGVPCSASVPLGAQERTPQERADQVPGFVSGFVPAAGREGTSSNVTADAKMVPVGSEVGAGATQRLMDSSSCREGSESNAGVRGSSFITPCGVSEATEWARVRCPGCGRERPVLPQHFYHVAIVGGGIAGLMAASILKLFNCRVLLIEASSRLGGRINTQCLPAVYMSCQATSGEGVCRTHVCSVDKRQDSPLCVSGSAHSKDCLVSSVQAEPGNEKTLCGLGNLCAELSDGDRRLKQEEGTSTTDLRRLECYLPGFCSDGQCHAARSVGAGSACPAHLHFFPEDSYAATNREKRNERRVRKRSKYWVFVEEDAQPENVAGDETADKSAVLTRRRLTVQGLEEIETGARQKRRRKVPADFQDFLLYGTHAATPEGARVSKRFRPTPYRISDGGGSSQGEGDGCRARANAEGNNGPRLGRKAGPRRAPSRKCSSSSVAERGTKAGGSAGGVFFLGRLRTRPKRGAVGASGNVFDQDKMRSRNEERRFHPGRRCHRGGRGGRRARRESIGTTFDCRACSPATSTRRGSKDTGCGSLAQLKDDESGNTHHAVEVRKSIAADWEVLPPASALSFPRCAAPLGVAKTQARTASQIVTCPANATDSQDSCPSASGGGGGNVPDRHSERERDGSECSCVITSVVPAATQSIVVPPAAPPAPVRCLSDDDSARGTASAACCRLPTNQSESAAPCGLSSQEKRVLTRCSAPTLSVPGLDPEVVEGSSGSESRTRNTPGSSSRKEPENDRTKLRVLLDGREPMTAVNASFSPNSASAGIRPSFSSRGVLSSCCSSFSSASASFPCCSCTSGGILFSRSLSAPLLPAIPVDLGANWLMFDMESPQYVWQLASLLQVPSCGLWGPGGSAGEKGGLGGTSGAVWEPMVFGTRWIDGKGRTVNSARVALLSDVKDAVLERVRVAFLRQRCEGEKKQVDVQSEEKLEEQDISRGRLEGGKEEKGEDREKRAGNGAGADQGRGDVESCNKQRRSGSIAAVTMKKHREYGKLSRMRTECKKKSGESGWV